MNKDRILPQTTKDGPDEKSGVMQYFIDAFGRLLPAAREREKKLKNVRFPDPTYGRSGRQRCDCGSGKRRKSCCGKKVA